MCASVRKYVYLGGYTPSVALLEFLGSENVYLIGGGASEQRFPIWVE